MTREQLSLEIKQGTYGEESVLVFTVPQDVVDKVFFRVEFYVNELFRSIMADGPWGCPSLGEVYEGYAWAELDKSFDHMNIEVCRESRTVIFHIYNQPETSFDRLDPMHEDWSRFNPNTWYVHLSKIKRILMSEAPL